MFACIVCGVCFAEIIIGEYFSPLFSYRVRRPTLATLTLDLCDTGFHPITVATSGTGPAITNGAEKPHLYLNGLFYREVFDILGSV